ncbi:unnamed protein product [Musa textilis]
MFKLVRSWTLNLNKLLNQDELESICLCLKLRKINLKRFLLFSLANVFSCLLSVFDPNVLLSSGDYNCTLLFVYCHCTLSYCKKRYSDFTSGMCKLLSFVYLDIIKRISIFSSKYFTYNLSLFSFMWSLIKLNLKLRMF